MINNKEIQQKTTPFEKRKKERQNLIIVVLKKLMPLPREHLGVATIDIWESLKTKGYHYDYRTLVKDLLFLEEEKKVFGITVFGGRGQGTKKYWRV